MKLTRVTFMQPMLLQIILAGHVAQLTQTISQLPSNLGTMRSREGAGGSSGGDG